MPVYIHLKIASIPAHRLDSQFKWDSCQATIIWHTPLHSGSSTRHITKFGVCASICNGEPTTVPGYVGTGIFNIHAGFNVARQCPIYFQEYNEKYFFISCRNRKARVIKCWACRVFGYVGLPGLSRCSHPAEPFKKMRPA